jgi:hypothetical protein
VKSPHGRATVKAVLDFRFWIEENFTFNPEPKIQITQSLETCLGSVTPDRRMFRVKTFEADSFIFKFRRFYKMLCFSRLFLQAKKNRAFYFERFTKKTEF